MLTANKLGALAVLVLDRVKGAEADFSPSATALLFSLHYRGPLTASELAVIAGVSQPTAVRVAGGLIARGYVERGPRVGKAVPLRLTRSGKAAAKRLQTARLGALDRLLEGLSGAERAKFEGLLDKLLGGATRSRAGARTTCRLCDHGICAGPACPVGSRATEIENRAGGTC